MADGTLAESANSVTTGDSWWRKALEESSDDEARNRRFTKLLEELRLLGATYEDIRQAVKAFDREEQWANAITPEFAEVLAWLKDDETLFLCLSNELTNYDIWLHCVQCGASMPEGHFVSYCPACGRMSVFWENLVKRGKS